MRQPFKVAYPWGVTAASVIIGVACGALITIYAEKAKNGIVAAHCTFYTFTDPTLDCTTFDDNAARLNALDLELDQVTAGYVQDQRADRVSIWIRDLTTKQTAGSNENETYAPASLMKLPLMIAYYKVSELQPSLLTVPLTYEPSSTLNDTSQDFAPTSTLVAGKQYSVEELIEKMIVDSDNDAAAMLLAHIDQNLFNQTLVDLGIRIPQNSGDVDFVTPKTYANIFRMLYNASYLSRVNSEKALELMSRSTFAEGLPSGVPAGVLVVHKYGEREVDAQDGTPQIRELHDCGIVYKKPDPYVLCIMTKGKNWNDLLSVIHDVSVLAYQRL